MTVIWLVTVFNFYLITFLVNTFQSSDPFRAAFGSTIGGIAGQIVAGIVFATANLRWGYVSYFGISSIGGFFILVWGLGHEETWLFPVLVLIA